MHNAIYTTDPATGESVTLSELAKRHGFHVSSISVRYHDGKRGQALVAPPDPKARVAKQKAQKTQEVDRRQTIMSASSRGLHLPFKQLGGAI